MACPRLELLGGKADLTASIAIAHGFVSVARGAGYLGKLAPVVSPPDPPELDLA